MSIVIDHSAYSVPLCVTPPSDLVGWWPGDQNAQDIAGDNDGTFTGTYAVPGKVKAAFSIPSDGSEFVTIPNDSVLEQQRLTVDAWVRNVAPGSFKYVLAKGANGCDGGASYALYTDVTGGLKFYISDGSSFIKSPDAANLFSGDVSSIWDGEWHFVAATYDGTNVNLYFDGQFVGSTAVPGGYSINYALSETNDLLIGNYLGCNDLSFGGDIDEVEIYQRALSLSEIQSIYNADSAGKCKLTQVNIDVLPGHNLACIKPNQGVVPVVVFGTANLDVHMIDTSSLSLNGAPASVTKKKALCNFTDNNEDLIPDLMCKFPNSAVAENSTAILTGNLFDNTPISGTEVLCTVP